MENYEYRKGNRTEEKFKDDLKSGSILQIEVIENWMKVHNHLSFKSKFISFAPLTPGMTGQICKSNNFRDKGDFKLFVENGPILFFNIEIKQLVKLNSRFSFKVFDVERDIKNKLCIAYVHHVKSNCPKFRIFSIKELKDIAQNKESRPARHYDNKLAYFFEFDEFNDWVDFTSMSPTEQYKIHLNKLTEEE